MGNPLISIVVPVFNVEKYVAECIKSIIDQTYENIQIILVDDGSTDRSGEICDNFAASDKRIEVIHQDNQGLVAARKSGLERIKGDYTGFVDADDYIAPDMIENLFRGICKEDVDFVHSGYIKGEQKIIPEKDGIFEFSEFSGRERFLKTAIFGSDSYMTASIWSKLYKSDFIKTCYYQVPDEASYGEDIINLCVCILNCQKIMVLNRAYYFYRYRNNSLTNLGDFISVWKIMELHNNIEKTLSRYHIYEKLRDVITELTYHSLLSKLNMLSPDYFQIARYYYPDIDGLQGKNIVVYGAGTVGKDYYAQICRYTDCKMTAWIDSCPENYDYKYIKVYGIEIIQDIIFDVIIIAVLRENVASEIKKKLIEMGVEESKIVWSEPKMFQLYSKGDEE